MNIPPHVLPVLAEHMADWAGPDRVFVGRSGYPMRGDAVRQAFARARSQVGMDGFTFHDLRHTGQTLAAAAGASLKDLMKRLGHSSSVAATRYLHAVEGRDAEIAAALSELAKDGNTAKLPRSITTRKRNWGCSIESPGMADRSAGQARLVSVEMGESEPWASSMRPPQSLRSRCPAPLETARSSGSTHSWWQPEQRADNLSAAFSLLLPPCPEPEDQPDSLSATAEVSTATKVGDQQSDAENRASCTIAICGGEERTRAVKRDGSVGNSNRSGPAVSA